ncbi:hypothetical protein V8E36_004123 [Tilletia maclaganii]
MPSNTAVRNPAAAAAAKAASKSTSGTPNAAKSPKPASKPTAPSKPSPVVARTLRVRTPGAPGTTRKTAIVVASSQETSGSDSTTPSSHKEDTQTTDGDYDPAVGTPPLGTQDEDLAEEVDDLVKDPHSVDVEMANFERDLRAQGAGDKGVKAPTTAKNANKDLSKDIDFFAEDFNMEEWEEQMFGDVGQANATGGHDAMDLEEDLDGTQPYDDASGTQEQGGNSHESGTPPEDNSSSRALADDDDDDMEHLNHGGADGNDENALPDDEDDGPTALTVVIRPATTGGNLTAQSKPSTMVKPSKQYSEVDYPLYDGPKGTTPTISWTEAYAAVTALGNRSQSIPPLCTSHTILHGNSFNIFRDVKPMREDANRRWQKLNNELGSDFEPITVYHMPQTSARRQLLVQFANKADFERAIKIKFYLQPPGKTNTRYLPDGHGPALEAFERSVAIHVNPTEQIEDVFQEIRMWKRSQHHIRITDLWAQRTGDVSLAANSDDPEDDEIQFTGLVIAICQHIAYADTGRTKIMSTTDMLLFPAFIWVAGSAMETLFHGRPEWCRGCRDGRPAFFHPEADCPTPKCLECHRHHAIGDCQRKRRKIERRGSEDEATQPDTRRLELDPTKGRASASASTGQKAKALPDQAALFAAAARAGSSTGRGTRAYAQARASSSGAPAPTHPRATPTTRGRPAAPGKNNDQVPRPHTSSVSAPAPASSPAASAQTSKPSTTSTLDKGKARAITPPPTGTAKTVATPTKTTPGKTPCARVGGATVANKGRSRTATASTPKRAANQTAVTDFYKKSPSHAQAAKIIAALLGTLVGFFIQFVMLQNPVHQESHEEYRPLKIATLNCGKGGLRRRLDDIFANPPPSLQNADVLLLQECNHNPPLPLGDDSGLARVLGKHHKPEYQDQTRDSLYHTPASCPWYAVAPTLDRLQLHDVYRELHPEGRTYTHVVPRTGPIRSAKRLDAIWVSKRLLLLADHASAAPTSSDHHAAAVSHRVAEPIAKPEGRKWKPSTLHPGVIRSPAFRLAMLRASREIGPLADDDTSRSLPATWTTYARRVQLIAQVESRPIGQAVRAKKKALAALQDKVSDVNWLDQDEVAGLPSLLSDLREVRAQLSDASAMAATDSVARAAFKPSSWMAASYLKNGSSTTIPALKRPDGRKTPTLDEQLDTVADFFGRLYSVPDAPADQGVCRDLLLVTARTRFNQDDIQMLGAPVTEKELRESLRAANQASSPGPSQWQQVQESIAAYESASGARLNRAKSNFFLLKNEEYRSPDELLICTAIQESGFCEATPTNGELRHLGHPIRVSGAIGPCTVSFGQRVEALGARISLLAKDGTDLALRVRLCNSLLTPIIWHYTAAGALPQTAGQEITNALKAYLFLGARAWLDPEILHLPKELGGLGLIKPDHMFTAQSLAILCHHLLSDDDLGRWLRRGLALALHNLFGTSPALLLLRTSSKHQELAHPRTRARGMWGRLIHALASIPVTIDPSWVRLGTDVLLELPWCDPERADTRPPAWSAEQTRGCINAGWETWGDILWLAPSRGHNQTYPDSWPLGPPGPKAAETHHIPRPGRKRDTKGPKMGQAFGAFWRSIDPNTRGRLRQAQHRPFEPSTSDMLATPRKPDPTAEHFPWHLLFHGRYPQKTRTRSTRLALSPSEATVTTWPDAPPATPKLWKSAWTELHATPASSAAISDAYVWMHRSARTAKVDFLPAPCTHESCTSRESTSHSFVECPGVRPVWDAAVSVARLMCIEGDLSITAQDIALGWPDLADRRPRIVLWRTIVIHFITTTRNIAIRNNQGDTPPPQYNFGTTTHIRSRLATLIAEGLQLAWDHLRSARKPEPEQRRRLFRQTWATGNLLLVRPPAAIKDDRLLFAPLPAI